ncbi:MAG: sulfatase, partial [Acidobacteriota bacterium]
MIKRKRKRTGCRPRLRFCEVLLFAALLSIAFCSADSPPSPSELRPNIVLILVDSLRPDKLGAYGYRDDISPEIDSLAAAGVRFRSVLTACSWTRPAVGSILTSLYPRTLGLYTKSDQILADRFTTLPEALKSHGYVTIGITANPNLNSVFNFQQGFDRYVDSDVVWEWMDASPDQKTFSSSARLKSAPEVFAAVRHLLKSNSGRPFFLFLHLMDTHERVNTEVKPEFRALFENYSREEERVYYSKVRQVSFDLGRFVEELRTWPGCADTLFIISTDHGEGLFDHPQVARSTGHGYLVYDSHIKVPLIFYHPGSRLKPGVVNQEVRLIDLLPTILD